MVTSVEKLFRRPLLFFSIIKICYQFDIGMDEIKSLDLIKAHFNMGSYNLFFALIKKVNKKITIQLKIKLHLLKILLTN